MMPSTIGLNTSNMACTGMPGGVTMDDLSRYFASQPRHHSRMPVNYSQAGHSMRVTKPTSAHNSPRSAILAARRKTLLNDGQPLRRNAPHYEAPHLPTPAPEAPYEVTYQPTKSRPVSWHPASQQQHYTAPMASEFSSQHLHQYPFPSFADCELYPAYHQHQAHLTPNPEPTYSAYTSPTSVYSNSPLSLPYASFSPAPYNPAANWAAPAANSSVAPLPITSTRSEQPASLAMQPSPALPSLTPPGSESASWGSFDVMHTYGGNPRCSAPPTPESYPQTAPQPVLISSSPDNASQPLEDAAAEEGEILYGMGLYDAPEKKTGATDLQMDGFRSAVSSLLGNPYCYPKPAGKGLKLEDAWEPPVNDDEDDNEEDEDDDEE